MIVSKETRLKMSKAHLGKPHSKHKKICINGHRISMVGRFKDYSCKGCKKIQTERLRRNGYMRVYQKQWIKDNPEKSLAYQRKYNYGVSAEATAFWALVQDNRCAICLRKRKLDVDHNHHTKEFRGLLCRQCNLMLGLLNDNPKIARRAAEYLEKPVQ